MRLLVVAIHPNGDPIVDFLLNADVIVISPAQAKACRLGALCAPAVVFTNFDTVSVPTSSNGGGDK